MFVQSRLTHDHRNAINRSEECEAQVSTVNDLAGLPTLHGGFCSQCPNDAIPRRKRAPPMTSGLDQSSSQVNPEWTDEEGKRDHA